MNTFQGIPREAFSFYAELEQNNNREWWLEHKDTYDAAVKEPLTALLEQLEPQFGPAKIFRPYRDVRFSQDKSPYKTAQGAFAAEQEGLGFYLHLAADGLTLGGGCHTYSPAQLARFRESVAAPASGEELEGIVSQITEAGYSLGGEKLKTVPRGFDKDHPRAELLKHKALSAGLELGEPDWLSTPAAAGEIASRWEVLRPLVDWVTKHAAP
ncbi:DUF2461 domain-containing protein [Arthrobacter celericrescens]|uniref:DUF2461 domain-containing protein n=1 Tax=Arthrobacter celericrescens TaxID=2320851 RepID=UPI000EA1F986|nr:DUF2461 domain-containing protein [Arthrobacter celericrescens]